MCSPSMQHVQPSMALSPEEETEVEVTVQEKEKMINISYELAAEASKRSKLVAGTSLERRGRGSNDACDETNACVRLFLKMATLSLCFIKLQLLPLSLCSVILTVVSVGSAFISSTSVILFCVVWTFFLVILCLPACVGHLALFHCSEEPVILFLTPSTAS